MYKIGFEELMEDMDYAVYNKDICCAANVLHYGEALLKKREISKYEYFKLLSAYEWLESKVIGE